MRGPGLRQSLRSFCLLISILGLERKFAPGMKYSGTWENFTGECSKGIVKNPAQLRAKPNGLVRRVTGWEESTAHSPTQSTADRSRPQDALLSSVPLSLPQALRKAAGWRLSPLVSASFCPAHSPLHLGSTEAEIQAPVGFLATEPLGSTLPSRPEPFAK